MTVNVPDKGQLYQDNNNTDAYTIRGDDKAFGEAGSDTGCAGAATVGAQYGPESTNSMGSIASETKSDPMFDKHKPEMMGMGDIDANQATGSESPESVASSALSGAKSDPEFERYPNASSVID